MKTKNYLRIFGVWVLLGVLPVLVSAKGSGKINTLNYLSYNELTGLDSVPKSQIQDEKNAKKQPVTDKAQEPKEEPKTVGTDQKKPQIKEVPKARPKLRPEIVTDRVKIKRPPPPKVKPKVKPPRVLRSIGI